MPNANIIVKEMSPRDGDNAIALETIFKFRLSPYSGTTIDITTLVVQVRITGIFNSRTLTMSYGDSGVTTTAVGTSYNVEIDADPDGPINFESAAKVDLIINVSDDLAVAMRTYRPSYRCIDTNQIDALRGLTSDFTEITVNHERARLNFDGTVASTTWGDWITSQPVEVFQNDILINSGYTIDYTSGMLTFGTALSTGRSAVDVDDSSLYEAVDEIEVNYKHSAFTDERLIDFMEIALAEFNGSTPISNHNISSQHPTAETAMILGGAYYMYIAVLTGFINQQTRVKWGEDDWEKLVDVAKTAKENVKGNFDSLKEAKMHQLASPMGIVAPSFTLPGGRSRFFSYVFGQGGTF